MAVSLALAFGGAAATLHLGPPPPANAQRIVSLAPSLSELVLALGAGERLVGVTRFDDDPRTAKLPRVGGYNDPEPETVLQLKPDLVLAQPAPSNRGPVEALARLGVPIDVLPLSTVADVEAALEQVAARLGQAERGRALVSELEARRKEVRARTAGLPKVRALLVFGLEPLVVAGPASFAGELLADAGGAELLSDRAHPFIRLSAEAAVAAQPELVVLCGVEPPAHGRPAIAGLEKATLIGLPSTALLHPGPRLGEALGDLDKLLHGGAR
jgi:iron complex transport system substrate-binding protein